MTSLINLPPGDLRKGLHDWAQEQGVEID